MLTLYQKPVNFVFRSGIDLSVVCGTHQFSNNLLLRSCVFKKLGDYGLKKSVIDRYPIIYLLRIKRSQITEAKLVASQEKFSLLSTMDFYIIHCLLSESIISIEF